MHIKELSHAIEMAYCWYGWIELNLGAEPLIVLKRLISSWFFKLECYILRNFISVLLYFHLYSIC
jgi:hypothetical protein